MKLSNRRVCLRHGTSLSHQYNTVKHSVTPTKMDPSMDITSQSTDSKLVSMNDQSTTSDKNMNNIIGYKLFRKMNNGYAPLFINKRQRLQQGVAYQAEKHPTKGYAYRPGWHACRMPEAPHLGTTGRVWCKVLLSGVTTMERPISQGGRWYLAQELTILEELVDIV